VDDNRYQLVWIRHLYLADVNQAVPVTAPTKPTVIDTQEVQLAGGGTLFITDIRTGTEFNRILKLPDGKFVVEGGYIENAHEPCF